MAQARSPKAMARPVPAGPQSARLAALRRVGLWMVMVEQNFGFATALADDVGIVSKGRIVWQGSAAAIRADPTAQHRWLGVWGAVDRRPAYTRPSPDWVA